MSNILIAVLSIWGFIETHVVVTMEKFKMSAGQTETRVAIYIDNSVELARQRKAWHLLARGGGGKLTLTYNPTTQNQ